MHYSDFPEETLKFLLPRYKEVSWGDERINGLKKKMAYAESVASAALYLLQNRKWHSGFIFFDPWPRASSNQEESLGNPSTFSDSK